MKRFIFFLMIIVGMFSLVSLANAVECNQDLSQGGDSCTVSSSLTLNGSYVVNMNGTATGTILIEGNALVLDCNNSQIVGNSSNWGIAVEVQVNVTVKNCQMNNYSSGLYIRRCTQGCSFYNNTLQDNYYGLQHGSQTNYTSFFNNTLINNSIAQIYLSTSNYNNFSNNFFYGNFSSIYIDSLSTYNTFYNSFFYNPKEVILELNANNHHNSFNSNFVNNSFRIVNTLKGNNWTIFNNSFYNSYGSQGGLRVWNSSNQNISNNLFYNFTGHQALEFFGNASNSVVYGNQFDWNDRAIFIYESDNIVIDSNIFNHSINNYDLYNVPILLEGDKLRTFTISNILVKNNIIELGCGGILARDYYNLTLINNSFYQNSNNWYILNGVKCGYELISAIFSEEIYKLYVPVGTLINDSYSTISIHNSTLLTLSENIFSNINLPLRTQGTMNLTHDLTNYWYKSFQIPYLMDRDDFYISDNFNNISTITDNLNYSDILQQGIINNVSINYSIFNTYEYYKNINIFSFQLNLYSKSNALIYNTNNSIYGSSNINNNDGNINITLTPGNASYVLDNFNLTEGVSRENSPLAFSYSTWRDNDKYKKITNTLSDTISGFPIMISIGNEECSTLSGITYTTNSGVKTTWNGVEARKLCDNAAKTVTFSSLNIEPATSSNELELEFGTTELSTTVLKILIGFLAITVLLFAVGGFMYYVKDNFDSIETMRFIQYAIGLLLFVIAVIILINHIIDSL